MMMVEWDGVPPRSTEVRTAVNEIWSAAAIWSADPIEFLRFPSRNFVRFFSNHGMLNILNRPMWRVIEGGSRCYADKLTAPWRDRVRLNTGVRGIRRRDGEVEITTTNGETEFFDQVVLAVHSDQALRLLEDASDAERNITWSVEKIKKATGTTFREGWRGTTIGSFLGFFVGILPAAGATPAQASLRRGETEPSSHQSMR